MCGRFTLTKPVDEITRHFNVRGPQRGHAARPAYARTGSGPQEPQAGAAQGRARYNIAPTQDIAVVRQNGKRELIALRWGLIPGWSRDGKMKSLLINARAETLTEKAAFRESVVTRRCLIPADGFYEWTVARHLSLGRSRWSLVGGLRLAAGEARSARGLSKLPPHEGGRKQPWHIGLQDSSLFAFAGLWDQWVGAEGKTIESCTIITTQANAAVAKLHDRMPVIVPPASYDAWLEADVREALTLLRAYPAEGMRMYPVSGLVSRTENDTPACLEPAPVSQAPPPLLRF